MQKQQLHKKLNKYFWDGQSNISDSFILRRIIEYASFPDLLLYPFDLFKNHISLIHIEGLRTCEKRKEFIKLLLPYIEHSETWDEAVMKMLYIKE